MIAVWRKIESGGDMARLLRIQFEGALYHVTARGNERKAIVRDDQDRQRFLDCLGACVARLVN